MQGGQARPRLPREWQGRCASYACLALSWCSCAASAGGGRARLPRQGAPYRACSWTCRPSRVLKPGFGPAGQPAARSGVAPCQNCRSAEHSATHTAAPRTYSAAVSWKTAWKDPVAARILPATMALRAGGAPPGELQTPTWRNKTRRRCMGDAPGHAAEGPEGVAEAEHLAGRRGRDVAHVGHEPRLPQGLGPASGAHRFVTYWATEQQQQQAVLSPDPGNVAPTDGGTPQHDHEQSRGHPHTHTQPLTPARPRTVPRLPRARWRAPPR